MVVILNTRFTEDKSACNDLSFCILVSSIVIEVKTLLIFHGSPVPIYRSIQHRIPEDSNLHDLSDNIPLLCD
jgi:hypothetical protein